MSTSEEDDAQNGLPASEWARLSDEIRQAHLNDVDALQAMVEAGLRREVARRAARFGKAEAAVSEVQARAEAAARLRSEIGAEIARIDAPGGRAEAGAAAIHGRVIDRFLTAVPAVNALALDEGGSTLAADTTDRNGYFRLAFSPRPGAPSARGKVAAGTEQAETYRVLVSVVDAAGKVLHRDQEAISVPAGAMLYRDVFVVEGTERDEAKIRRRVYHVTPRPGGGWNVQSEGATRPTSKHDTKEEAVARGRELAKAHGLGQLIIHRKDGRIETEYTYGEDPRRTPG